jgi:hypothetical protein
LAKPNYGFEKRQRELAKKQKKEAKRLKKSSEAPSSPAHGSTPPQDLAPAPGVKES